MVLDLILLVFSFVCFVLACWQPAAPYHPRLIAAGLAFFVASFIFHTGASVFSRTGKVGVDYVIRHYSFNYPDTPAYRRISYLASQC
jgi:ABC-type antimicrobial peptide transport system permease subunit